MLQFLLLCLPVDVMKFRLIILPLLLTVCGCQSTFGPAALHNTHPAYNQAISNTLNEQMLLNLVRLRYRDRPYFLKVGSVTASMIFDSNIGIGSELDLGPGSNLLSPSLGLAFSDKPTISYQPLQGEEFLKSVLSSLSFDSLLVMTQSGWSIERVFGLCVERVNNLHNAPTASGPTPQKQPEYTRFKQMLKLMRELQLKHQIEIGPDVDNQLYMLFKKFPDNSTMLTELMNLLEIDQKDQAVLIRLDSNFLHNDKNELRIRTRSISGVLFYLSQQVSVPELHQQQGLVSVTQSDHDERTFNWSQTPAGEFFNIHSSEAYPERAFLAVPYRDYWFYIADDDLKTKSTLMLLTQLFDLQSGRNKYSGPTLTLPVQ
jgi:hypothetical protein